MLKGQGAIRKLKRKNYLSMAIRVVVMGIAVVTKAWMRRELELMCQVGLK